jgi:hypothetical protein
MRARLDHLCKRLGVVATDAGPPTVVLREATPGERPARRERTDAAGLPVVEVAYDPAGGPVQLPPPPYKLVYGTDPVDLV